MKNSFHSVLQWFRPAHRAQPEERISPEQLRRALEEMLADPESRRFLARKLMGAFPLPVLPPQGGTCTAAADVSPGAFGSTSGCGPGDYSFPAKLGIGTTSPISTLQVAGTLTVGSQTGTGAIGNGQLLYPATSPVSQRFTFGTDGSGWQYRIAKNQGGTVTDLVTIDDSGKVGIGTTSPGASLDVPSTAFIGALTVGSTTTNNSIKFLNAAQGTVGAYLDSAGGVSANYNGVWLESNANAFNTQANANLASWAVDLGGRDKITFPSTGDAFRICRKAPGGTYSELVRVNSSGNVGIGTTSPAEKLDVNGKVRCQGLNIQDQIVFLAPTGSGDGTKINMAITNLPGNGGIIYLMPGTSSIDWSIDTTILINRNGIKLRGYGGAQTGLNSAVPLTKLLWAGGAGTSAIISVGSSGAVQDIEISDLEMDGNGGNAGIGLLLNAVTYSRFKNLAIYNVNTTGGTDGKNGVGLKLFVTGTTLSWNVFERISVLYAWKGVVLDSSRGTGVQNPAHNTFTNMNLWYCYKYGMELGDCDNNSFRDITGPGALVEFPGAEASVLLDLTVPAGGQTWARSNYFYHLQAAGKEGLVGIVGTSPQPYNDAKNVVIGYDYANGEKPPRLFKAPDFVDEVFNVTDYFFWTDSYGASSDTEFRNWNNGKRAAMGLATPGDVPGDNLAFSTFDGTAWSRRVTVLNSNGNVGIGDPNPVDKLTVNGKVSAAGVNINTGPVQVGGSSAKGDIVTNQTSSAAYRLPVGSDGSALVADSTQTGGIKWLAGMLNCQNGNKKVKFGVGTFSSGSTTVNTGLTSVDFFFSQLLNAGQTGDSISINYPSGGNVDCYLTSNGNNQFYWFAVGS